jgi:esterase/lipase
MKSEFESLIVNFSFAIQGMMTGKLSTAVMLKTAVFMAAAV